MKKILVMLIPVLIGILYTPRANAQDADGYLVTLKGDTLRGAVHILSYDLMDRVSVKGEGKKKNFTAVEVRMVVMDSSQYVAVQFENSIRLMKVIKTGYLSLYAFKLENQHSFDGRLLVKMNGAKLEIPNIQFKKLLADFLEDCERTSKKVKNGEFGRSEIIAIVDDYNNCVQEQNKATAILVSTSTPLTEAIFELRTKVQDSKLESKKDVMDLLASIETKARLKEPVPGYQKEGLKSYLTGKPEFEAELNKVLELMQ
jgi:hypothetical protein